MCCQTDCIRSTEQVGSLAAVWGGFDMAVYVCMYNFNPLIGLTNKKFEMLKSTFLGVPGGFEHFGPRIRIPREQRQRCI